MARPNDDNEKLEILIVEDSPTQSARLEHLLSENGYRVTVARSGEEGLSVARARRPSLVITDVVMPGMDGYELCTQIRSDPGLSDVPVVLLTALSRPEDIFRGLESGADNFVRKPYEDPYLLSRVENVLLHRSRQSTEQGETGVAVTFGGRKHLITAERQQILDVLISTTEETIRLNEGLARTNRTLNILYRIADRLNRANTESQVYDVALEQSMNLFGARYGWIYRLGSDGTVSMVDARKLPAAGSTPTVMPELDIDVFSVGTPQAGDDGTCACIRRLRAGEIGEEVQVTECARFRSAPGLAGRETTHATIPLRVGGKTVGIINLRVENRGAMVEEELATLDVIGSQISTSLERAHLRENLAKMVLERTFALTSEIEERKIAQESQARLTEILEATPDLVVIADAEGRPQYLNAGGRRLLGVSMDFDFSGLTLSDLHAGAAKAYFSSVVLPAATTDGVWTGETVMSAPGGKPVPVSAVIIAHRGPGGRTLRFSIVARDNTESLSAKHQIQTQFDRLTALREIDRAITSSLDVQVALRILLEEVTGRLNVDAAQVLVFNADLNVLEQIAARGFRVDHAMTPVRLGEGMAGTAALKRRTVVCERLAEAPSFTRKELLSTEQFVSYLGVPLVAHGRIKGVLEVFHRSVLTPEKEWMDFLEALAGQAAISVNVTELFDDLQRSNVDLSLAYDATIEGWSRAMDLRDRETEGHTLRVTEMVMKLGRRAGLRESELVHVRRGALLHDIGKMGVPDSILLKPGRLDEEEWKIMRRHPEYAYEMLSPIAYLRPAIDIPYCHHEKWDGSGYPRGLRTDRIPLTARLFAVVDVWDALSSERPYRAALPKEEVIAHLRNGAGSHFDPDAVTAFLEIFRRQNGESDAGEGSSR